MEDSSRDEAIVPLLRFRGKVLYCFYNTLCSLSGLGSAFRKQLVSFARISGKERIIDIGSGTGSFVIDLKRSWPGCSVIGIEPDERSLDVARKEAVKQGVACDFIGARSEHLPIPDASVEICFQILMLHHLSLSQKREALLEAKRVLVPGGRLIIADFRKIAFPVIANFFLFEQHDCLRENFEGKVEELLEEVGFSIIEKKKKHFFSIIGFYSVEKTAL